MFDCDVLVNPANKELKHKGGLAKSIVDRGGKEIQDDCSKQMRMQGNVLQDGSVFFSKVVGKLPCKALIHAVGPKWNGGNSHEDYLLQKVCKECLTTANGHRFQSIAFPAISTGAFDYPLDKCAKTLIDTCILFVRRENKHLSSISFVLIDTKHANAFLTALEASLSSSNVVKGASSSLSPSPAHKHPGKSTHGKSKVSTKRFLPQLHQGELLSVKADVYVNSALSSLDLTRGMVSKAILQKAGPQLQAECNSKAPVMSGSVTVTGPGKLDCRHVFHIVLNSYFQDQQAKELRQVIKRCLKECNQRTLNSIAFPALGTGGLKYPTNLVAKAMFEEITNFLSSTRPCSITEVHIVVYQADMHKIFKAELDNMQTFQAQQPSRISGLLSRGPTQIKDARTFSINRIKVQITRGDITSKACDAIVNTTSPDIKLDGSGGVSKALLKKGGQPLQAVCDAAVASEGKLQPGKVIVSRSVSSLQCSSIFHVYVSGRDQTEFVRTIRACLLKAEDLNYSSIALPAIGTGSLNYPTEHAASGFIEAIQGVSFRSLKEIYIVLYLQDVYDQFVKVFKQSSDIANDPESDSSDSEKETDKSSWLSIGPLGYLSEWWNRGTSESSPNEDPYYDAIKTDSSRLVIGELHVIVFGENSASVERAKEKVQAIIDSNLITEPFSCKNIRHLTSQEHEDLRKECEACDVHITFDIVPGIVSLRGEKEDVQKMKYKVEKMANEAAECYHRKEQVHVTRQQVQWKFLPQTATTSMKENFAEYDPATSYEIEQAYLRFRQHPRRCKKFVYNTSPLHFTINFKKMTEENHVTHETVRIRREIVDEDMTKGERPYYWDRMPIDPFTQKEEKIALYEVLSTSSEYKKVEENFNKSMSGKYSSIVKIERIQNPSLYGIYTVRKRKMEQDNSPNCENERYLFHGTTLETCQKINVQGFNRSFAGKNATVFGSGTYFARDAEYSARSTYSTPDPKGQKYMYLAKVLTGEFTVGKSDMSIPPPKDPNGRNPHILFDSLVNNLSDPSIFVVYGDGQAYPDYLITFQ